MYHCQHLHIICCQIYNSNTSVRIIVEYIIYIYYISFILSVVVQNIGMRKLPPDTLCTMYYCNTYDIIITYENDNDYYCNYHNANDC